MNIEVVRAKRWKGKGWECAKAYAFRTFILCDHLCDKEVLVLKNAN